MIGVRIGDDAAGFWFPTVVDRGVLNDEVGGEPLVVWARPDRQIRVYSRDVDGRAVALVLRDGRLVDPVTGTAWDPLTGQGQGGPLAGPALAPIPWATSYDWAWLDFYPDARIVR